MAVITISRQLGSLGDEAAGAAADKLGYARIGRFQIGKVLAEHGFSDSDVDRYDETNPSLLQHLSIQTKIYEYLIRGAVYEFAARDNVVIVGRGAQVILKEVPGTLHVRVIAPHDTRVNRLMEQRGIETKVAHREIMQGDRNSSGYIQTYFRADWENKELYDLVINTRKMTLTSSVEMIRCAVHSDEFRESSPATEQLMDLALTQKAKAVMLTIDGMEAPDLVVQNGVAYLPKSGMPDEILKACEHAILKIRGITGLG